MHQAGVTFTDKEARTLEELRVVVDLMQSRGWMTDGPPREIDPRREPGRLTDMRFVQRMYRSNAIRD